MRLLSCLLVVALFAAPASVVASATSQATKQAAPAESHAADTTPAAPAPAEPAAAPGLVVPQATPYTYTPDGRRDPFQSLTAGGDGKAPPKTTASGIAGIRVDELSVRGIMQSRERLVAMVQGSDNRTYLIHQGDKLADGVVKSITPRGLVLVQDVSDPRSKEKTREVRKLLRTPEDDKE
jgi:Tfp pilus assembly protein PilP